MPSAVIVTQCVRQYYTVRQRQCDPRISHKILEKRGKKLPKCILIAIIECKTQLGWNRGKWEEDFEARKTQIIADFPSAKAYLLVMTDLNWGGFKEERHQALLGKEYFCLLKGVWPGITSFNEFKSNVFLDSCIEKLLVSIIALAQSNKI
jgi:hypothetical protein